MKSLLMLEGFWGDPGSGLGNASVRHFVEGIARYHNVPMHYSNFIGLNSFRKMLQHLAQAKEKFQILYIGAHGGPGALGMAQHARVCQAIKNYSENIKIVIFGSCCGAANNKNILKMMKILKKGGTAPNLFFGYRFYMDWVETTLVDCQIISTCLDNKWQDYPAKRVGKIVRKSLGVFNKDCRIGAKDISSPNDMTLEQSLVVFCREQATQDPVELDNLF